MKLNPTPSSTVVLENQHACSILAPDRTACATLAEWISRTGELSLISAETSRELPEHVLHGWIDSAASARSIFTVDEVIAFGTLSTRECELSADAIELCHVIVRPDVRRRYRASQLVLELTHEARQLGYRRVVARVAHGNTAASSLLLSLRWTPFQPAWDVGAFDWFEKKT